MPTKPADLFTVHGMRVLGRLAAPYAVWAADAKTKIASVDARADNFINRVRLNGAVGCEPGGGAGEAEHPQRLPRPGNADTIHRDPRGGVGGARHHPHLLAPLGQPVRDRPGHVLRPTPGLETFDDERDAQGAEGIDRVGRPASRTPNRSLASVDGHRALRILPAPKPPRNHVRR